MTMLINSAPPLTNPSSDLARKPCEFLPERPKFYDSFLQKKRFCRVFALAHTRISNINSNSNSNSNSSWKQSDLGVKDGVFVLPNWNNVSSNDRIARELKLYDAILYLEYMVEKGYKPDLTQATNLVHALCQYNKLGKATRVMLTILRSGSVPGASSYAFLVKYLCKVGATRRAIDLVEKIEEYGYTVDMKIYNILIRGLYKQGGLNLSLGFVDRMLQKGLVPDAYTHSIVLEVISREKGVDEAMVFLEDIVAKGGKPNLVCYNALLIGLCKESRVDEAVELLRKLPSKGIVPCVSSYNIILRSLSSEGRWEETNRLLADMDREDISPTGSTYNILIDSLASHGRIRDALDILEEMHSRITLRPNADSYNPIIARLCKEKKVSSVIKYLNQMIDQNCDLNPRTYNAIAVLCEDEEMVHEAFKILERLRAIKRRSINEFYRSVISILCRMGNTYPAFLLLYDLTVASGFIPDKFTYSSLIKGLCKERMPNAAIEIVRILEANRYYKPTVKTFCFLVVGLCKCGRTDLAMAIYEEMIAKGYVPDEKTYGIIVEGLVYEDEKELAGLVLKELHMQKVISTDMMEWLAMQYDLEGLSDIIGGK